MFAGITTGWFVSCLSVFYCLKIASFTQRLFLQMKQRICGMVPQLLLGSLLLALLTSSFQDPSTEAHVNAIKILFSCLMLYVCSFVADTLSVSYLSD
ncbi:taste receptor type 2 member 2-like [Eretmochelys imbricata]